MSDKKFQWSKFINNREEQIVIRTDDKEEFIKLKDEFSGKDPEKVDERAEVFKKPITATPYQSAPVDSQETKDAMDNIPCAKCGAKQILSKKGNWVCSAFCWTK